MNQRVINSRPLTAQFRRLAGQRLAQLALGRALHDPAHPGPQVSPATGELAQRSYRGGLFIRGQLAPRRVMFRLPIPTVPAT